LDLIAADFLLFVFVAAAREMFDVPVYLGTEYDKNINNDLDKV
jgi:hypothetical protein